MKHANYSMKNLRLINLETCDIIIIFVIIYLMLNVSQSSNLLLIKYSTVLSVAMINVSVIKDINVLNVHEITMYNVHIIIACTLYCITVRVYRIYYKGCDYRPIYS